MNLIYSIKKEAQSQKITITEIAERLGMSQQSLSQMLKPESIKFSVVQKIADILNVSIDYLLGEKDKNTQQINGDGNIGINGHGNKVGANLDKERMLILRIKELEQQVEELKTDKKFLQQLIEKK
jgi:transcriptional regulator with XRE-family HTH domain